MDQPSGLRERKKTAIRRALHDAALRLAVERGIENVTVEAIADAAMLSRRTFSNHFSSKEEALFYPEALRARMLLDLVHARPAEEGPRTAFTRAAAQMAGDTTQLDAAWLTQRRLLRKDPALIQHHTAAYTMTERDLAAEIARRLPGAAADGLRARVLAATFLAALRAATTHWLDSPERPLPDLVEQALRLAQE